MMAGLAIENADPIILDSENTSYEGPNGLFRIVVDQINGDTISSWHIEDKYEEISRELGGSDCKSLDAIVGRVSRFTFEDAIRQLRWTSPKRVNKILQENEQLRKALGKLD
jgi:hypothetical protein